VPASCATENVPDVSVAPTTNTEVAKDGSRTTTQNQHLCSLRDVRKEDLPSLISSVQFLDYNGTVIPIHESSEALQHIVSGELKDWRGQVEEIVLRSKDVRWRQLQQQTAITAFIQQILPGGIPTARLDGLLKRRVLRYIPLNNPLNEKLEKLLLTPEAASTRALHRSRQIYAQMAQRRGHYSRFEDETGFKPDSYSNRDFVTRERANSNGET
jgi:hypothetical protein